MNVKRDFEQIEKSLAALILERRKELGMTLQELADRSGLSTAFLSQAERGKTTPSLVSTLKLAEALEVDIGYFITPPEPDTLVRRAAAPARIEMDSPLSYYRLDGAVRNKKLTVLLIELPPHSAVPAVSRDEGEECIFVLSGELHTEIDDKVYDLGAGDSLHLNSQSRRSISNLTDSATRCIWVSTPSIFDT